MSEESERELGPNDAAVVDTNVLSFLLKGDSRAADYSVALAGRRLVISFQTVAELFRWAEEHHWGERRRSELEQYLKQFLVYPYSAELAHEWAAIMAETKRAGRVMAAGDGWIAATARLLGAPLATHNRKALRECPG